jgi:hypothetical protein
MPSKEPTSSPSYVVLYRWRLHSDAEAEFTSAWSRITELMRARGSWGSRLHRGSDSLWYGYACWPSAQVRADAFRRGPVDAEAQGIFEITSDGQHLVSDSYIPNDPLSDASAVRASFNEDCASTTTPFMERTRGVGQHRGTRQPGFLTRLRIPRAISESSSLKPSKVRISMCIEASR